MLSASQQERYARHLLLDELGGEGQERLAAGTAIVQLPAEAAATARWATRYLAASGLGTLLLEGPWAEEAAAECARLWPDARVHLGARPAPPGAVRLAERSDAAGGSSGADGSSGAEVTVAGRHLGPAEAAALGSLAALEVVKRVAGAGRPAVLPLRIEAAP
jgi:hypothetical protein